MPLYEYACLKCDHHFDVRHGADDKPALSCPQCESDVRKVFHAAGVIFKGSGWHITDYAKKDASGASPAPEKSDTSDKPAPTPAATETAN